jgi:UPF0042 nucleotide-binding protein
VKDFVLITGQSGAGKSQAAGILEDMGYFCVDNLPTELLSDFIELCLAAEGKYDRVALVSDLRGQRDPVKLAERIKELREKIPLRVLFLECEEKTLLNRYKETRHLHPLDPAGADLSGTIRRERELLEPIRALADVKLDTTGFTWSRLKLRLSVLFQPEGKEGLFLHICSFGYKNGLPAGADLVMDVRFLPNPFYVPELKELTGLDEAVRDYVCDQPAAEEFLTKMKEFMAFLLPRYQAEGKPALLLAMGCTGGKHRSVVMAEQLTARLRDLGYPVECVHRDLR